MSLSAQQRDAANPCPRVFHSGPCLNFQPSDDPAMSIDEHHAQPDLEIVSFDGTDGEDASVFLRDVKRIAFAQGRQRDHEWLIDYTESCLAGAALTWFLGLNNDLLDNWRALQMALINRFPSKSSFAQRAPAPAAISPPKPSPVATTTQPVWSAPHPTMVVCPTQDDTHWPTDKASQAYLTQAVISDRLLGTHEDTDHRRFRSVCEPKCYYYRSHTPIGTELARCWKVKPARAT